MSYPHLFWIAISEARQYRVLSTDQDAPILSTLLGVDLHHLFSYKSI